jgi:Fe-S-cluster containining protein
VTSVTRSLEALRFAAEERPDARFAHALLDDVPRTANACAAGCAFCCHLPVLVTPAEADLLAEVAWRMPDVRARIENPTRRCAFLSADDRCLAYDARPLRCRAHTSSDRSTCERVHAGELPVAAVPPDAWLRLSADAIRRGLGGTERELHAAVREAMTRRRSATQPRPRS